MISDYKQEDGKFMYKGNPIPFYEYAMGLYAEVKQKEDFLPSDDRLLIFPYPILEQKTAGGIILTQTAESREDAPKKGLILRLGANQFPGKIMGSFEPGDLVVYSKYSGTEIELGGVKFMTNIRVTDIWGVIEKGTATEQL